MGGAQVISILASIGKMKFAAVLLGPAGVGLFGIYTNLFQTAAAIASLGISNVGTRQVAAANANSSELGVARTRRALFWGALALASAGGLIFWLLSGWIARVVLSDSSLTNDVRWLALGVTLTVAAGSQIALLTGLHRVTDLARINIGAGVIGGLLGVLALWLWPRQGLIVMTLITPLVAVLIGLIFVLRLGRPTGSHTPVHQMAEEWRAMVRLGLPFMASSLVTMLGQLAIRTLVQRGLGTNALGQFQAAWTIGMTYLGVIVGAMATDYYPRLTAAIRERAVAVKLINEQTEVALLLCAPALLGMLGLTPWVMRVLYSPEFEPASEVLRWQLLGDIPKVLSFPLAFVLLASGAGKTYLATEIFGMGILVIGVFIGLPILGVKSTGVAFLATYLLYLPLVWWLARRRIGFRWTPTVRIQALAVVAAAVAVDIAARWSDPLGAGLGVGLAVLFGIGALSRLSAVVGAGGRLGRLAAIGEKAKFKLARRKMNRD